ncbi:MarR family transcriptional regulator [Streptomyces sp. SID13031]|uniref:GbsR/MarR family transcriptional regulator n=1 Tax=Streptomyces sp. SID13031 TaxID=2706046 RepID=UPI0013C65AF9|nr:MarR family transcriptional regulator [Streptomyces sp. SID13031]NEA37266.1 MarR family transcriptional regulator [Streptomyces sp. SID13031]
MSSEPTPAEVSQFVERFAGVLTNSGVPSMSARVMARMLVSPTGTMTAAELAESLQISQPAVSGAVRQLIQVSFITRERLPGSRKDHYRIRDDVFAAILERRNNALGEWESSVLSGVDLFGPDTVIGQRLTDNAEFFAFIREDLNQMIKNWRATHPAR